MSLLQEIWIKEIQKQLFQSNEFLKYSVSHNEHVNKKIVHIPQQGSYITVGKNPTSFPLTAAEGTNTDLTYSLDYYYTQPIHITDLEKIQMSFPVLESTTSLILLKIC
jgi:hypothetical protein